MTEKLELERDRLRQSFKIALGANIRQIRRAAKKSLVELSKEVGLSKSELSHVERAERDLPVSYLPVLARVLDVSVSRLMPGHETCVNDRAFPQPPT